MTRIEKHFLDHARYKRQFDVGASGPQIDLNITVPYIFSARLYPYGPSKEDKLVQVDPQPFSLHTPLKFLTKVYNAIYVSFRFEMIQLARN